MPIQRNKLFVYLRELSVGCVTFRKESRALREFYPLGEKPEMAI